MTSTTYKFLEVGDVVEWDLQALIFDVEKHTVCRQKYVPILDLV